MNGILFDEYGDLLRCKFAGEKNSCSSQLLVITQSKTVMFLEDYLEAEGYENLMYMLLCLEAATGTDPLIDPAKISKRYYYSSSSFYDFA